MRIPVQRLARETGIAVAVLAIYVLTLLLPLHQAAGLQRYFNALGFSTLDNWSVCASLAEDENGDPADAAALACPAVGTGKQLAMALPPAIAIKPRNLAYVPPSAYPAPIQPAVPPDHVGQSRAPPVTV